MPNLDDYICGHKFKTICDTVYQETPLTPQSKIIFCKTDYVLVLFKELQNRKDPVVLVTHNSDYGIDQARFSKKPPCVKKWFAQNIQVKHPDLIAIPIGIANKEWPHGNFDVIKQRLQQPKNPINKAMICFTISNNAKERSECFNYFRLYQRDLAEFYPNNLSFEQFIEATYNYKFIASPPGNGVDCLRTWESLYLHSIPIVKRSIMTEAFSDLPIIIIDRWEQITKEFLDNISISADIYSEKLFMPFWEKQIKEAYGRLG